jgi:hypothetical protein
VFGLREKRNKMPIFFAEFKLAFASLILATTLSVVIIAFIVLESIRTSADVQDTAEFDAITGNFTQRIETAFNTSLVTLEVLVGLFTSFPVNQRLFSNFLNPLAVVLPVGQLITWNPVVLPNETMQFELAIRAEVPHLA